MGILDGFRARPVRDHALGELRRRSGRWAGALALPPHGAVPLFLAGGRGGPDADAVSLARALPTQYAALQAEIAAALLDHLAPYREAVESGELRAPAGGLPPIARPGDVWAHVTAVHALVEPLDRALTAEIAYRAAWDEEHTLGARIRDGRLLELNGSVLPLA